jgi:hypothetical protein
MRWIFFSNLPGFQERNGFDQMRLGLKGNCFSHFLENARPRFRPLLDEMSELSLFHVNCHENLDTFPFDPIFCGSHWTLSFSTSIFAKINISNFCNTCKFVKADMRIWSFLTHIFLNAKKRILRICVTEFFDNFRESAKTNFFFIQPYLR